MRAILYVGSRELQLTEVADPTAQPGETVIVVAGAGICGSELHGVARPDGFRRPPLIMGHEVVGWRQDTGEPAAVNPLLTCGSCDRCGAGQTNLCRHRQILGIHRPGGYAERVAVPLANLHALPPDLSMEAAVLAEPLANAIHAWNLRPTAGLTRMAIIGAGPIGLMCLVVAASHDVPVIEVADLSPQRQHVASRLGATTVRADLDGEYDLVIDAVGSQATRQAALTRLRPGGVTIWLGLHDTDTAINGQSLVRDERMIVGSFCYTDEEFRAALAQVATLDPSQLVTSIELDQGVTVFDQLLAGRTDRVKVMLAPDKGGALK